MISQIPWVPNDDGGKLAQPLPINSRDEIKSVVLYEFAASPYCCTVRALLNLSKIPYTIVPVNMGSKAELKFSKYKKVPVITVNSLQINDSEQIMKVLSPICFGRNCTEVEIAQIEEIGRLGASAFTLDMFEDAKIRKRCIGRFMNPGGCVGCLIQVRRWDLMLIHVLCTH